MQIKQIVKTCMVSKYNQQTNEQKMLNVLRIKHKLRNKQHTHKNTTRICSLGRDLKECVIVNEENQKKTL